MTHQDADGCPRWRDPFLLPLRTVKMPERVAEPTQPFTRSPCPVYSLAITQSILLAGMAAMKTLFVVLMCLVAALAAFSSPVEAKGKVNLDIYHCDQSKCFAKQSMSGTAAAAPSAPQFTGARAMHWKLTVRALTSCVHDAPAKPRTTPLTSQTSHRNKAAA